MRKRMSDNANSFAALPWDMPKSHQNFVPQCCRSFVFDAHGIFIAWRNGTAMIFTFEHNIATSSTQKSICSLVVTSKEPILDVVTLNEDVYFVSSNGLFQVLCSQLKGQQGKLLEHLAECKTFYLTDAFELTSLKTVLSVNTKAEDGFCFTENFFAVVTRSKDSGRIDLELYKTVKNRSKTECRLELIYHITSDIHLKVNHCASAVLTDNQAKAFFPDIKDAQICIVGLETGQLFCVPFYISSKQKYAIKPTTRLIYQSDNPVFGLACPQDGLNVLVFFKGGNVLKISLNSNHANNTDHNILSFDSFTLPYPIKSFSISKSNLLVVTDTVSTHVANLVSPAKANIQAIPVRGVSALATIPGENLIIASTFHNIFYLIDPLNTLKKVEVNLPWAACDLDVSLQLVEDMKMQTELLSKLRHELKEEDHIIKALSAAGRTQFLAKYFAIVVNVSRIPEEQEKPCFEESAEPNMIFNKAQQNTYQLCVKIQSNSPEDLISSLWKVLLLIRNQDGLVLSKTVSLTRQLNQEFPFSALVDVPFTSGKFLLPVQVNASLVARIKENEVEDQWLKIPIGTVTLDISHFFSVSPQPPQKSVSDTRSIFTFLNQMQACKANPLHLHKSFEEKLLMNTYAIPIEEKFRQRHLIIDKILFNCQHRSKVDINKLFEGQSDNTVIWLSVLGKYVKLVLRKSCSAVSISSTDLSMLHSVKLCLAKMFSSHDHKSTISQGVFDASDDAAYPRAKNLLAVLETLSLEGDQDGEQMLVIYQDLRSNVSSHIY